MLPLFLFSVWWNDGSRFFCIMDYLWKSNTTIRCIISELIINFISLKQPLADAIFYKKNDVIKLLEKHGAKPLVCVNLDCKLSSCSFICLIITVLAFVFCWWLPIYVYVVIILFQMAPMHVNHAREVPEYELNPKELDFTHSVEITKVKTLL